MSTCPRCHSIIVSGAKFCHKCGYKKEDLELTDRRWICPKCGTTHDRDENAKFNLLNKGINLLATDYDVKIIV